MNHPPADNFETLAIRSQGERSAFQEHSASIYATSSFLFEDAEQARRRFADEEDGPIYSRFANPNTDELATKLALLEGTEAGIATASGMAAVFGSLAGLLKAGDHVIASRALFGSTHQILTQILPRWDIACTYVDGTQPDTWDAAVTDRSRMFILETPTNPGLDLVDLEQAAAFSRSHDLILNVDNCFATPYLQNPAPFGADLVTHSGTKFIDGQGRVLGGAILGRADLIDSIRFFARHSGPSLSPFNAWILSKSLETLAVRMEAHCDRALALARFLESASAVEWVKYPHLPSHPQHELALRQMRRGGALVSFELKGGLDQGGRFLDALKMVSLTANLGDTRTIATHPASTTHAKLTEEERRAAGITPGLVRISAGLETESDILADIAQAIGGG
ncbi:MAG: aminotransferase class I/II-fold pyridoxal phosphate-dependent enzyme [Kiritimatiellae bacterium]|nr:aminotransferase class I/II-fold pyridoxal phosphate-dependent enzyme [Kiritimatiellia bacterium]